MQTMSGRVTRFLGDTPGRTLIKLIVVSFIVGVVMTAMDWHPMDVVYWIVDAAEYLWATGFSALGSFGTYLVVGAMIVVPAFLVLRLLNFRN
jgi:hypothetical protein